MQKGWNVLHYACAGGSVEVLEQLLTVPVLKTTEVLNGKTKVGAMGELMIHLRGWSKLVQVSNIDRNHSMLE